MEACVAFMCEGCRFKRLGECAGLATAGNSEELPTIAKTEAEPGVTYEAHLAAPFNKSHSSPGRGPLSEESIMASHRKFQERDRAKELMERGDYDNKTRLVYYSTDNPPTCSVCGIDVQDQVFIQRDGLVWCIDHAPHLQKNGEICAYCGTKGCPQCQEA